MSSRTGPFRLSGHFCMAQRFMFRSVVGYQVYNCNSKKFRFMTSTCSVLFRRISINSDENQQTRESPPSESGHSKSRRLVFYSIYGWGVPFTINIVGQVLETIQVLPENIVTPNFEQSQCWFLSITISTHLLLCFKLISCMIH